ncbi:hypothetical protein L218DRAFT_957575 [Marasmius fiardii PR-910]|nr:hypothetical protein L218DRAFT_957575 [Marasmius fiardii PR-910]
MTRLKHSSATSNEGGGLSSEGGSDGAGTAIGGAVGDTAGGSTSDSECWGSEYASGKCEKP